MSNEDEEIEKQLRLEQEAYQQYIGEVNQIRNTFALQMKEEYNLLCSGHSGMLHGKIEELGMQFIAKRRATIEEARALELVVIGKWLQSINSNKKIQPFLEEAPFTHGRVQISIAFEGKNEFISDGTVSQILNVRNNTINSGNGFIYFRKDGYAEHDPDPIYEESYEEAMKLNAKVQIDPAVHYETKQERLVDQILGTFVQQMWDNYGLGRWSIGRNAPNGVEEIGAKFIVFKKASRQEARQLLVKVVDELVKTINNNPDLRLYLKEYPFPSNRIKLRLCFRDKKYVPYYDKTMESVTLDGNQITFLRKSLKDDLSESSECETESYSEALKIVQIRPASLKKFNPASL